MSMVMAAEMQHVVPRSIFAFTLFFMLGACAPPASVQLLPDLLVQASLGPYGKGRGQTGSASANSFVELQLNLCNSGFAGCYAGGDSIPEGGELIWSTGPNVVTINEICSDDVTELQSYLGEAWPDDYTYSVFMPAVDKRTRGAFRCKNGFFYGSVVLGRVAAPKWKGIEVFGGKYTSQDDGNEERIFTCAAATGDHFACATHLSSTSEPLALAQCRALLYDAVPFLKSISGPSAKTVVGGDFNLEYDREDAEDAQKCVPSGWTRKGDGSVQHVVYTNDLNFASSKKYRLSHTDHDGWLVKMTTS